MINTAELVRLTADYQFKEFDCGDSDLNEFLLESSKQYLVALMAVTYIFEYENKVAGFYSVLNDRIINDDSVSNTGWKKKISRFIHHEKIRPNYPSVKLGRLGVHSEYQKSGFGSQIIKFIKFNFTHENKTGCRFITVDAYNHRPVLDFYQKNEFDFFTKKDESAKTRLMYYDLMRFLDPSSKL